MTGLCWRRAEGSSGSATCWSAKVRAPPTSRGGSWWSATRSAIRWAPPGGRRCCSRWGTGCSTTWRCWPPWRRWARSRDRALVLLAYSASMVLAMIPITPGGLGFVEAGLTGLLALAGVNAGDAVLATLAYRMVSFWLPLPARRGRGAAAPAPLRAQERRRRGLTPQGPGRNASTSRRSAIVAPSHASRSGVSIAAWSRSGSTSR